MNREHVSMDVLHQVAEACRRAGKKILEVYDAASRHEVDLKADGSPVTRADLASHALLLEELFAITPQVPVLSEESDAHVFEERRSWAKYWLIDPLDGTKEFIKRNGEFTVNVGLVEQRGGVGVPVAGVVHAPATDETYFGSIGIGAWKIRNGSEQRIHTSKPGGTPVKVIASRSHNTVETTRYIDGLAELVGPVEIMTSGSSLKLCRVAEGAAHYYPRLAPTMEWDTAAAHAIVEAAGGVVWQFGTRTPLRYGKTDLRNPSFLVTYGDRAALPSSYAQDIDGYATEEQP